MKAVYSLAFVLGALLMLVIAEGTSMDELKKIQNDCKVQEKATDEDIQQLMNHKLPTGVNGKCLLACIHEAFGDIKDGKLNVDALKERFLKEAGGDDKAVGTVNDVVEACKAISNPDRCEFGFLLRDCIYGVLNKKN